MRKIKLLFQGDSITDAGRDRADCHNLGEGYPKYAAKYLQESHPEIDFEFIDLGISGNQKEGTSEWYDFYHYDLGINIVYEVEGNKFAAYLDGKKLREIQYAHELQHILWALGLNAELKL